MLTPLGIEHGAIEALRCGENSGEVIVLRRASDAPSTITFFEPACLGIELGETIENLSLRRHLIELPLASLDVIDHIAFSPRSDRLFGPFMSR